MRDQQEREAIVAAKRERRRLRTHKLFCNHPLCSRSASRGSECYWHWRVRLQNAGLWTKPLKSPPAFWTAERVAEMERLFAEQRSTAEIARLMSVTFQTRVTKNMVIGRCDRTGLVRRTKSFTTTEQRIQMMHDKLNAVLAIPIRYHKPLPIVRESPRLVGNASRLMYGATFFVERKH